jgi:hypothetical protein
MVIIFRMIERILGVLIGGVLIYLISCQFGSSRVEGTTGRARRCDRKGF